MVLHRVQGAAERDQTDASAELQLRDRCQAIHAGQLGETVLRDRQGGGDGEEVWPGTVGELQERRHPEGQGGRHRIVSSSTAILHISLRLVIRDH